MSDMIGKTYSYSVLATKTVGDGYWMYIRVVSEWNNLGVIHRDESGGWVSFPSDYSAEVAIDILDKTAEKFTWMEPINREDIYGYLEDRLSTELFWGKPTEDYIEIPLSTLVEKFGQKKVDILIDSYLSLVPNAENLAKVDFDILDGVCVERESYVYEYKYFKEVKEEEK